MTPGKSVLMGAAFLVGATLASNVQAQYQPYPYYQPYSYYSYYQPYPYGQIPPTPPSWSYDPYTSGLGPCPQWRPGDLPCSETMHPTYGQPSYRSR